MAGRHSLKRNRSGPAYSPAMPAGRRARPVLVGTTNLDLGAGSARRHERSPAENETVVLVWLIHGGPHALAAPAAAAIEKKRPGSGAGGRGPVRGDGRSIPGAPEARLLGYFP